MSDLGFVVQSVATSLAGLLVSDAYTSVRPRLSSILRRSGGEESPRIEDLDRLREADPATLEAEVRAYVQRLADGDERLLRQLQDALGTPERGIHMNIHDNQFRGPTQMGGVQIVNMYEADHEPEL
ncbi:hypothetical protein [Streptomyces sp. Da 82-17]|uniref:hypothetical protein n=1 Tax=Streptomyces sp. Da 82-17 TaxID=3377116 RepID=UPI0038D3F2B5